ncbi:MAG: SusC/RagA family TonB-linked outer membrane protein [Tannerellaceae bacterium]|nr:SusC/RagA family TonB-linked outer membrane protein [Tannerellaceae bacterium]
MCLIQTGRKNFIKRVLHREFYKTGFTQDYNVDVSGGNQNGNYMFSFNYFDQDGTVKGPDFQRFTLRSNTETKIGMFTIGENLTFGRSVTHPINGSPFLDLARMPPVIPVYDSNNESGYGYGTDAYPTYGTNPIGLQELRQTTQTHYRFLGNGFVQMNPFKGLTLKSSIGVEYNSWYDHEVEIYDQIRYNTEDEYENRLLERKGDFLTWIWENTALYSAQIDRYKFDILVGYSAQRRDWKQNVASARNLTPGYWVLDQGTETPNVEGSKNTQTMASWLGRINYDYDGRYLVQFNICRDGSSRFGTNYRYGTFPSASVGWRISEENFFETARSWVDDLKLRASYGVLGDQQALDNYAYDTYISTGEGGIFGGNYYPGKIQKGRANPDLKWETKRTLNLGIDFSLFEQRFYGTAEYYNSISKDLLVQAEMAWVEGTDESSWTNLGKVSNRGLDLTLGYRENKREFKYDISFNMSTLRNRLLALDKEYRTGGENGINRSEVGRSMSEFWVLRTDGIFQSWDEVNAHKAMVTDPETGETYEKLIQPNAAPGDIRYKDLNGDGTIDHDDREVIGKAIPTLEFGLNFSAEYKNFDFNIFFAGVTGNKIYNGTKYRLEVMNEPSNFSKNLSPWSPENPSNTTPRPYLGANDNTLVYSYRWIEDGKYIRLKNIQVEYTLPRPTLAKLGFVQSARVYVGAQNLFTITGYSGLSPEISGGNIFGKGNDTGHYPPVRTITAGIQMSF